MSAPDLRLAPLALGCWAAALTALHTELRVALALAGLALVAAGVVVRYGRGAWRWIVAAALLGIVCGAAATGARLSTRDAPELAGLVAQRAVAEVELTVTDDPRPARGATGRPATWLVPAQLTRVGDGLLVAARVLVLAGHDSWSGLLPGQRLRAEVRFAPSRGGDLRAAVLSTNTAAQLIGAPPWPQRAAASLRAGLQRACVGLDPATGGLLPGLVVGDTSRLDPTVQQQFRDVGMTHLTAVSGDCVCLAGYSTTMRAVIYTRVSSDPNDTGRSVEQQEAECRQVCAREGWTTVKVFSDNDRSASRYATKDRPGYTLVKQFLDAGGADVLVLWEGSRAQRDLGDYVKLRDLCEQRNVLYNYSGRTYDLTRTDDRFNTGLDALLGEREAGTTRDRVLRGVRANMASGRPYGRLVYGYRRVYDDRGVFVEQVAHEEQAAVVREAARRVMAGEACRAVALDFNARGIPAAQGGQWDLTQIRRLVTQPAYVGHKVHKGQVVGQGDWPALLDETTYAACVARMADPRRKAMRDGSLRHLLSGAIRCGVCGGFMRVQKNRGWFAYICEDGFCVSAKTTDLEEHVTAVIVERLSRLSLPDLLGPPGDDLAGQARVEHADLTARLESFYEQAAAGTLSSTGLAKVETRLLPQIADAARRAQPVPVPQVLRDVVGDRAAIAWEGLNVAIKREIIYLLAEIKIQRVGRGVRTFRPERVEITWKTPG